jgi:hypothetical protein
MRLERFDGDTDYLYMSGNTNNEVVTRTVDTEQKQYGTSLRTFTRPREGGSSHPIELTMGNVCAPL